MSETHVITDLPETATFTVALRSLARKTAKVAIIGAAVVGGVVLVQRFRAAEDETGGTETA